MCDKCLNPVLLLLIFVPFILFKMFTVTVQYYSCMMSVEHQLKTVTSKQNSCTLYSCHFCLDTTTYSSEWRTTTVQLVVSHYKSLPFLQTWVVTCGAVKH